MSVGADTSGVTSTPAAGQAVASAGATRADERPAPPARGRAVKPWQRSRIGLLDQKGMALALLLVAILLSATGELLLKHGMSQIGVFTFELPVLVRIFLTPQILLGFTLVFGGAIFWLAVISRVDLSFAYPMLALGYVVVVFASAFLFHEPLTLMKLAGVGIICAGVIVLSQS